MCSIFTVSNCPRSQISCIAQGSIITLDIEMLPLMFVDALDNFSNPLIFVFIANGYELNCTVQSI